MWSGHEIQMSGLSSLACLFFTAHNNIKSSNNITIFNLKHHITIYIYVHNKGSREREIKSSKISRNPSFKDRRVDKEGFVCLILLLVVFRHLVTGACEGEKLTCSWSRTGSKALVDEGHRKLHHWLVLRFLILLSVSMTSLQCLMTSSTGGALWSSV